MSWIPGDLWLLNLQMKFMGFSEPQETALNTSSVGLISTTASPLKEEANF